MLTIEGGTVAQQTLSRSLYGFCLKALQITPSIEIDLSIRDIQGAHAWTDHEKPKCFYMVIDSMLERDQFIVAFCHEMVHVAQYLNPDRPVSEDEAYALESQLAKDYQQLEHG